MIVKVKNGAIHLTIQNSDVVEDTEGNLIRYAGRGFTIVKTLAKSDLVRLKDDGRNDHL